MIRNVMTRHEKSETRGERNARAGALIVCVREKLTEQSRDRANRFCAHLCWLLVLSGAAMSVLQVCACVCVHLSMLGVCVCFF